MTTLVRRFPPFLALCALILSSCFIFLHPTAIRAATGPTVQAWLTTSDGSSQLTPQPNITFGANTGNASTITVNESQTLQQMVGFGAAVTDSSAWLIYNKMSTSQRATLMQNLFDPNQGIGIDFVRIPMGASDFSVTGAYSYDDLPAGQTDPNLNSFSISHDLAYILPVLQQARSLNPNLTFMANPWSPPAWMKTNGSMLGTNASGASGTLNSADYGPLAQYFVKFIQAYQAQGIPISEITPQNEPEYAPNSYPGMLFAASDESNFIKNNLSPALKSAGLSTGILGWDHNWGDPSYPSTLLSDPTTSSDLAGIAWHCYGGSPTEMTTIYNSNPAVGAYETECATGAAVTPISTPDLLMQSVQNEAKTVELWNIALDPNNGPHTGGCPDCLGVVTINQSTGNVTYTNDYYQVGQYSKFVVPGAYHIASNTLGSLADVAFKNPDGSKVVVAHNDGTSSSSFQVLWNNQGFNYTLPAGATVTFKWSGTSTSTPTPTPTAGPGSGSVQINAGGPAASPFVADTDFTGGTTSSVTNTISTSGVTNPAPQAVYQSNRYGNFTYTIPGLTANGSYTVRLHFAEEYWTAAGKRVFNVSINGTQVLTNFDIFATAGGEYKAVAEQFSAMASSSGTVTIQFTSVTDNAQVNGIEILGSSSPTPTPTPTLTPTPTPTTGPGSGSVQVNAGGPAVAPFVADTDFTGGATASVTNTISTSGVTNPAPQAVYQSNRYGNFTYTIPGLTAGHTYTVRLHFAEEYWTAAGKRVFNVSINGTQVLTNFDIFATAGGEYKAVVEQFSATASSSGAITIQFTSVTDNAQVNGIEILS
jgi:glucosylceramidase